MIKNNNKISIVCASHKGKGRLPNLISSINNNSVKPFEIILCVTDLNDTELINDELINNLNIKVILSKKLDQSYQRQLAIKHTKCDLILQLDDDLILDKDTIKTFIDHFKDDDKKKIVSAVVLLPNNELQSYRWNNLFNKNPIFKFIILLLNGFKKVNSMSILKSGRIAPLLFFNDNNKIIYEAEWLNSCILYRKEALKDAKYLFSDKSKSYFEDVFFSHSLYKKNYLLIVDSNIIVRHHYVKPTSIITYLNLIKSQYRIVKSFNKNVYLFYIDVFIFFNLYLISTFIMLFKFKKK